MYTGPYSSIQEIHTLENDKRWCSLYHMEHSLSYDFFFALYTRSLIVVKMLLAWLILAGIPMNTLALGAVVVRSPYPDKMPHITGCGTYEEHSQTDLFVLASRRPEHSVRIRIPSSPWNHTSVTFGYNSKKLLLESHSYYVYCPDICYLHSWTWAIPAWTCVRQIGFSCKHSPRPCRQKNHSTS